MKRLTVVIDGNDGTGKTTLAAILREAGFEVCDRGLPTIMTDHPERVADEPGHVYLILDCDVSTCQQRLLSKGKSLLEKYHTADDLAFYRERFRRVSGQLSRAYIVDSSGSAAQVAALALEILDGYRKPSDRLWRFLHGVAHVPLALGEPRWAKRFHDWTARKWSE